MYAHMKCEKSKSTFKKKRPKTLTRESLHYCGFRCIYAFAFMYFEWNERAKVWNSDFST